MLRLLVFFAFVSGMCGISYEVLFSRLLTTYLGDMFHVSAAILATFLLGIGVGALVAHRFLGYLWLVEGLIGLYAALLATLAWAFSPVLLKTIHPWTSGHAFAVVMVVFAALSVPSALIGFSVPLFSAYLKYHARETGIRLSFDKVYFFYNLGAAACVLAIEYYMLRHLGVRDSLYVVASVNLFTATTLKVLVPPPPPTNEEPLHGAFRRFSDGPVRALFAASLISGVYQLFFLKLAGSFFGPYHENFALVVALGLAGISLGTWWARVHRVSFRGVLIGGAGLVAVAFLLTYPVLFVRAAVGGLLSGFEVPLALVKVAALVLIGGVPYMVFGATVPALVAQSPPDRRVVGHLLFVSSLGNSAGYLLAVLVLFGYLSNRALAILIPAGLLVSGLAWTRARGPAWRSLAFPVTALGLLGFLWVDRLTHLDYLSFASLKDLRKALSEVREVEVYKRYDSQVSLIQTQDGREILAIDGYRSLTSTKGQTIPTEIIYGLTPSIYAPAREHALVLGIGKGITAGTVGLTFRETVAVDVNPAIFDLQERFAEHNFHLTTLPGVTLVLDDGLSYLAREEKQYDAIVNTVTTPLFFASSKLYTKDFLELVKSRLRPGGVYAMWFDSRVTEYGARVIFDTIRNTFAHCVLMYLKEAYNQVLCSDSPLVPRLPEEGHWPAPIREKLYSRGLEPINAVLEALILPKHRLFETSFGTPENTFDRPVLEFTMASSSLAGNTAKWSPYDLIGVDPRASIAEDGPMDDERMSRRCYYMAVLNLRTQPWCERVLVQDRGHLPLSYIRALVRFLRGDHSSRAIRVVLIQALAAQGAFDEALSELDLLAKEDPRLEHNLDYRLTRSLVVFQRDLDVPDDDLMDMYRLAPTDPELRRLLARVSARRGMKQEAMAHVRILRLEGLMTPADEAFERSLQQGAAE